MRGELVLDQLLQLGGELFVAAVVGAQYDERLQHLTAQRVGNADDGGLHHPGMGDQDALDVEGSDPVAGHDDHVVVAG